MNILALNLECYRVIFGQFPLNELICHRSVCRTWCALIETICADKHVLSICCEYNPTPNSMEGESGGFTFSVLQTTDLLTSTLAILNDARFNKQNSLVLYGSKIELIDDGHRITCNRKTAGPYAHYRFVGRLFPRVKHLVLLSNCDDTVEPFTETIHLLHQWAPNLVTLAINDLYPISQVNQFNQIMLSAENCRLWKCIESMRSLRRLHLFGWDRAFFSYHQVNILAQLEQFSINALYGGFLDKIYSKMGPNLKHLRIGDIFNQNIEYYRNLSVINPYLTSNLTHLSLRTCWSPIIQLMCSQLVQLAYLDISFTWCTSLSHYVELFGTLVHLQHLETLKIHLNFEDKSRFNYEQTMSQLPSIKVLGIRARVNPCRYHFIRTCFPNVQLIQYCNCNLTTYTDNLYDEQPFTQHYSTFYDSNSRVHAELRKTFGHQVRLQFEYDNDQSQPLAHRLKGPITTPTIENTFENKIISKGSDAPYLVNKLIRVKKLFFRFLKVIRNRSCNSSQKVAQLW